MSKKSPRLSRRIAHPPQRHLGVAQAIRLLRGLLDDGHKDLSLIELKARRTAQVAHKALAQTEAAAAALHNLRPTGL